MCVFVCVTTLHTHQASKLGVVLLLVSSPNALAEKPEIVGANLRLVELSGSGKPWAQFPGGTKLCTDMIERCDLSCVMLWYGACAAQTLAKRLAMEHFR